MMKAQACFRGGLAACCGAALWLTAGSAVAQQASDQPAPDPTALGNHQRHVRGDIGVRTQFVRSRGLDPFATNDVLPQLTLSASYAFWARERTSLAAFAGMDYGGRSAPARSGQASLDLVRFTLAPELRYHVLRVLAVTAKVGPTLTREGASFSGSLGTSSTKTAWKAGFDAMAGVAFEVFGYASGSSNKPRLWVTTEGGYGWTAPNRLSLKPEDAGAAPQRLTPLDLGELSLRGPLFRVTAALSFW